MPHYAITETRNSPVMGRSFDEGVTDEIADQAEPLPVPFICFKGLGRPVGLVNTMGRYLVSIAIHESMRGGGYSSSRPLPPPPFAIVWRRTKVRVLQRDPLNTSLPLNALDP